MLALNAYCRVLEVPLNDAIFIYSAIPISVLIGMVLKGFFCMQCTKLDVPQLAWPPTNISIATYS